MRTEQLGKRQFGALGLHVPQRDVERRDRLRREAAATDRSAGPHELVPQPGNVVRILAKQLRRNLARVRELPGSTRSLRIREADSLVTFPALDFGEEEGD